jgi:predicted RNase H-like HicB family nuclease
MPATDRSSFTIALEPVEEGWFIARVEEFPEVVTGAPTRDEARLMALDALREYLAACAEQGTAPVTRGPQAPSR